MDKHADTTCEYPILLVDDDPFILRVLSDSLDEMGYSVVSARNGREALELAENGDYPLILSDWVMPEMDGVELCKRIRSSRSPQYTYIILLTSLDTHDSIIKGLEAGADEYLIKPVNPAELTARLKTARRIIDLERSLLKSLEEIRALSLKDPLTDTFNRRYLDDRLPREIKRAYRFRRPLSVLMMDIDHFKSVNDNFGHHVGDLVLKAVMDALSRNIRDEVDWIARYGGEEFVIVLPETPPEGMMVAAERLRQLISSLRINHDGGELGITASFGAINHMPLQQTPAVTSMELVNLADRCMYESKQSGRNKVTGSHC
jgi:two-component system, cell cycle response regulator